LELYRGHLLPAFFIATPAFERWLETERARLQRRATTETSRLCESSFSAGDLPFAVHWARRWNALQPDDERAVSRLIFLLERGGQRAEARHVYDRYRRLLREEFQLEPAAAIEALLSRRGADPTPTGTS
jgi:DNA-binding SARP family transcriptional activator